MSEDYDKYRELSEETKKKQKREIPENRPNVDKFLDIYLGLDGVFLLQVSDWNRSDNTQGLLSLGGILETVSRFHPMKIGLN